MNVKHNDKSLKYLEDKSFVEWLESQNSIEYQNQCRDTFLLFLEFLEKEEGIKNPTGDMIIEFHKQNRKSDDSKVKYFFDDCLLRFVEWLKQKRNVSYNSAITLVSPLRGFFSYFREPLKIRRGKLAYKEIGKRYHFFTFEELRRMVQFGNLEEKTIITMGANLGLRVSDFANLKRSLITEACQNNPNFPLEFQVETAKENILSISHVTKETYDLLIDYWKTVPDSEFCFSPSHKPSKPYSDDYFNDVIKNCWGKAYPERKDVKVRFHELRSYLISILANAGLNQWVVKRLTGKKISDDMKNYLSTNMDLKAEYMKASKYLQLTGNSNGNDHEAITNINQALDLVMEVLRELVKDKLEKNTGFDISINVNEQVDWYELYKKLLPIEEREKLRKIEERAERANHTNTNKR